MELIQDTETGYLVSNSDGFYEFSQRVQQLLSNVDLRIEMGRKARYAFYPPTYPSTHTYFLLISFSLPPPFLSFVHFLSHPVCLYRSFNIGLLLNWLKLQNMGRTLWLGGRHQQTTKHSVPTCDRSLPACKA